MRPLADSSLLASAQAACREGRFLQAERCCRQALKADPGNAESWQLLGFLALQARQFSMAARLLREAMHLGGPTPAGYTNLGLALHAEGRKEKAADCFQLALALRPKYPQALNNLGAVLLELGQPERAVVYLKRALQLQPGFTQAQECLQRAEAAGSSGGPALAAVSWDVEKCLARAQAALRKGENFRAMQHLLRAVAARPDDPALLVQVAARWHGLGRPLQAANFLRRALAREPNNAQALNQLGNLLQEMGRFDRAETAYRRAVQADPDCVAALQNLAYLLSDQGKAAQAGSLMRHALAIQPSPINRVLAAVSLPVIYESEQHLLEARKKLRERLSRLVEDGVKLDVSHQPGPTLFYAPYQGLNDRELQESLARVYVPSVQEPPAPRKGHPWRIQVGVLSRYLCRHTIGHLNLGLVQNLDRKKFEVHVLSLGRHRDPLAHGFRQAADQFLELPYSIPEAYQQVRHQGLDILLFTDVGMDPVATALAYSRLAPVQCTTWGHPVTTGSPAMDWFISAQDLETEAADTHYTEKLLRLPRLVVSYERPAPPKQPLAKEAFGLDPHAHLYLCPQSLFKFHPEFDPILAGILRADPEGLVVLLEGKYPYWTRCLQERFLRQIPDVAGRIRFLPRLSRDRFLALNALADVLLDPIHFGGGNTSYEGFALGVPIVTLPSEFLRGRITYALYRQTGMEDAVVHSADAYVYRAVRLGTDHHYRQAVSERIRQHSHLLFGDVSGIRALEGFFQEAVSRGPRA